MIVLNILDHYLRKENKPLKEVQDAMLVNSNVGALFCFT